MKEVNAKKEAIIACFKEKFGGEPLVIKSPGRINLIGEHTDYNNGYVMPAAIEQAAYVAIAKSGSKECKLEALDLDEQYSFSIDDALKPVEMGWVNYFLGVLDQYNKKGLALEGFNMVFTSDVPLGAGLSSSAALECSFGFAVSQLFGHEVSLVDVAKMGQQAEHNFAGVKCGIMDQFASCLSTADHAIMLDCRSLEYTSIPCDLKDYQLVLFDTAVKHNLASSEYNVRREQCESGVAVLQKKFEGVESLRDATMEQLDAVKSELDAVVYDRCAYVISENNRVLKAAEALKSGDIELLGKLMTETHEGLSKQYEVSCAELDLLADIAKANPDIIGARMMGGGFGGCTINIVKKSGLDTAVESVLESYKKVTQVELKHYIVAPGDGATLLKN
ncbi:MULTISPECIES: galactokinase [Reichenbachiella]|uniref:Galactokinase n=1 Tax=Reichenbachiella agariperforans TaxID=156994 RepID=A0A1M6PT56_REIAG|nr:MULTISPECIES: galactokinase [Reichenbachiella]MBU2912955.1 galactokinase [Reichenbachiella agariperforans]SHK11137.1 galactokinase [Reichenbachiella agariperforans]